MPLGPVTNRLGQMQEREKNLSAKEKNKPMVCSFEVSLDRADALIEGAKRRPIRRKPSESYYRARYYDQNNGRFISEDPIEFLGGSNFYAYVENSPVDFKDELGLCQPSPKMQACLDKVFNGADGRRQDTTKNRSQERLHSDDTQEPHHYHNSVRQLPERFKPGLGGVLPRLAAVEYRSSQQTEVIGLGVSKTWLRKKTSMKLRLRSLHKRPPERI